MEVGIAFSKIMMIASSFSMGALLELSDRAKLEQYFFDCHDADIPKNIDQGGSLFDYFVNDQGQWGNVDDSVEID